MPIIPYEFDYGEDDYIGALIFNKNGNILSVKLPEIPFELTLEHDRDDDFYYPDIESIKNNTPNFKFYPKKGFTIGNYSEFLIVEDYRDNVEYLSSVIGSAELSIGRPSPVLSYLLDGYHDHHVHPDFQELYSIRLHGINEDKIEAYLMYSFIKLHKETKLKFTIFDLFDVDYLEDEQQSQGQISYTFPNSVIDIEPLRFYYKGFEENDYSNAFIQFYKVIEYYSFMQYQSEISNMRTNSSLSNKDFIVEVTKILSKDEKSPICRLISRLANASILSQACSNNLIEREEANLLANKLYEFRNSIIHAKYDQRSSIISESLFDTNEDIYNWKNIIEQLAFLTIEQFGTRDSL